MLTSGALTFRMSKAVDDSIHAIAEHILSTTDVARRERLWPADYLVFATNPLSVAYGACGTALFLREVLGELPAAVREWLLDQPTDLADYPPGLYIGLAGIAYAFGELGYRDRAEELMQLAYRSPLLYEDPGMLVGIAGWGWASLYFYDMTRNSYYLEWAVRGGKRLLEDAGAGRDSVYWRRRHDGQIHLGFAFGASGISLFLLNLGLRIGSGEFTSAAMRALEFDIAMRTSGRVRSQEERHASDDLGGAYYSLYGDAGCGTATIRFCEHLGSGRYRELSEVLGDNLRLKIAPLPGQWEGMSGIGEFHLDLLRVTGDKRWLETAEDLAKSILCFAIEQPSGLAFPGRWLNRISTDYATGSAGIGLFLWRLANQGRRLFIDLPGPTTNQW